MFSSTTLVRARRSLAGTAAITFFLSLLCGCGGGSSVPEFHAGLVPTRGTITLGGQPLVGAAILFLPDGPDGVRQAYGLTSELGDYELTTPVRGVSPEDSRGAVPGKYKVVISKLTMRDGSAVLHGLTEAEAQEHGAVESIPAMYSSSELTELVAEVVPNGAGPLKIDFQLKK